MIASKLILIQNQNCRVPIIHCLE